MLKGIDHINGGFHGDIVNFTKYEGDSSPLPRGEGRLSVIDKFVQYLGLWLNRDHRFYFLIAVANAIYGDTVMQLSI